MKKNILFLYGQDSYRSRQKVNAVKQKYIDASLGDTNLAVIDGEKATIDELVRQLYALPFLAKSRLVVIENIFDAKAAIQEKVLEAINNIPASTVVLFYERANPDKRTKFFKYLSQNSQVQIFDLLEPHQINRFIRDYAVSQNATIDPTATELLNQIVGPDLWRLKNELDKLILYNPQINAEAVNQLVNQTASANVFELIDAISERSSAKAYRALQTLLTAREESLKILALVARSLRIMAIIKAGRKPPPAWKIHPYVLQKTSNYVRNFSEEDLKNLYRRFAKVDYLTKTGTMEGETALALFIADATKQRI